MKKQINEIGDTPKGQYALGQVSARALDRAFSKPRKETNGIMAGNPKYGKVSQDACYTAARGQDDMAKKRGYKRIVDVPDDERHEIGSYFRKGGDDYRQKHTVKLSESQLRGMIAESVKKILFELDWKTANRAADIQSKWKYNGRRGGWDRYRKFIDYSDDEANLKFFGQKGGVDFIRDNDNDEGVSWVGFDLGYPQVRINDRDKFGAECQIVPTCIDYCHVNPDTLCAIERFTDDGSSYYHGISNEDVRKYFGEESELFQRFMDAVQEYTDLKNYKYRYDDKQGWHLKESVDKVVKTVMNEYISKKK